MKAAFFGHRVHASHGQVGTSDGQDHPRQSGARSHIQKRGSARQVLAQRPHDRKAVQQMVCQHLLWVPNRRQVVNLIPFGDQVLVGQQLRNLRVGQNQAQLGQSLSQTPL